MTSPQRPRTPRVNSSVGLVDVATGGCEVGVGWKAPSWAAAACEAFPMVWVVGVPRPAPAVQTRAKAFAYAGASGERSAASRARVGVGVDRHRRPRDAAAAKSSADRSPPVWATQSTHAPVAASATVAARASPSPRASGSGTPAAMATSSRDARAADRVGLELAELVMGSLTPGQGCWSTVTVVICQTTGWAGEFPTAPRARRHHSVHRTWPRGTGRGR